MLWFVQVLIGLLVVIVIYIVFVMVYGAPSLSGSATRITRERHNKVLIVPGHMSMLGLSDKMWSTNNPYAKNFLPLTRSLNQRGAIEFSYQFWINISSGKNLSSLRNQTILLRGSPQNVQVLQEMNGTQINLGKSMLVMCPRIAFGESFDELQVSFNTLSDPFSSFTIKKDPGVPDRVDRQQALKLVLNEWALLTFTFRDNVSINDFHDGIEVDVYLNDSLYYMHVQQGTLKVNHGDFWIAPSENERPRSALSQVELGDVRYTNYALSISEIIDTFSRGPPKKSYKNSDVLSSQPLHLTEYNKLDIYNS